MGYRRQPKVYNLKWEDEPGLEVLARSPSVGELLKITRLADELSAPSDEKDKQLTEFFGWFARHLIGWNLEEGDGEDAEGKPVPPDLHGVLSLDMELAMKIAMTWVQAISGTLPPLAAPSSETDGTNPLEGSIPMSPPSPVSSESASGT